MANVALNDVIPFLKCVCFVLLSCSAGRSGICGLSVTLKIEH